MGTNGLRNISFSENFTLVLNGLSLHKMFFSLEVFSIVSVSRYWGINQNAAVDFDFMQLNNSTL